MYNKLAVETVRSLITNHVYDNLPNKEEAFKKHVFVAFGLLQDEFTLALFDQSYKFPISELSEDDKLLNIVHKFDSLLLAAKNFSKGQGHNNVKRTAYYF